MHERRRERDAAVAWPAAVPGRIGMADVDLLTATTRTLRALDYRHGGGSCCETVVSHLVWGRQLLNGSCRDSVRLRLYAAVADLHNLAGWTSFDTGQVSDARFHFHCAASLARQSGDQGLLANILYRLGRVALHQHAPAEAAGLFERGQVAAKVAGSPLAAAILYANQAWAQAMLGAVDSSVALLGRARDALTAAQNADSPAPSWASFFDDNDMAAMTGTVYTELARIDPVHANQAIPALTTAVDGYGTEMARSNVFCLTALAVNHLCAGDHDEGVAVGGRAVDLARGLTSVRVWDRMRPLRIEAFRRRVDPQVGDLTQRMRRAG